MGVISDGDIIKIGALDNAIKQAKEYLALTEANTASIIEMAKALKTMVSANPMASAKDYSQIAGAMSASKQALKEYNKEQAEAKKLQKQLTEATDAHVKGKIRLQQATAAQKKLLTEEIALENKQLGTKERLTIENAKLTRALNKLNLETSEGIAKSKEYITQLNANNATLKKFSSAQAAGKLGVGQYTEGINKARIGLNNLASAFGIATGIMLFTNALKGAFNIIRENEDAFASLSAITGLTGEKFEVFKTAINTTAKELKVSSTEVASAAEKIASAQPKLLESADALADVTKRAIILNKAIKGDLTETSMALVGVMNQFGYGAEQAARVINVLAAGSKAGAATVNQLNESMTKSGAVAKLQGLEVEELTGAIETLGEKAIFGADAGTALRNILLKMGGIDALPKKAMAELEKYGVNTAIVGDKTLDFSDRLKELSKIAGDSTAIMKVFGTENATAATVLLSNIDTYDKMTDAVTGTNVAQEQAAVNTDTLSGAMDEMKAVWANAILEVNSGTGAGEGFKDVIKEITKIIPPLVRGLGEMLKNIAAMIRLVTGFKSSWAGAFDSMKNFKNALADTVDLFLGWMPGVKYLSELLRSQTTVTKELTAEQKKNNLVREQAITHGTAILKQNKEEISDISVLFDALMNENTTREEKNEIIAKLQSDYPAYLANIDLEAAGIEQLITLKKMLISQMLKEAIERKKAEAMATITDKIIEFELNKIGKNPNGVAYWEKQVQDQYKMFGLVEEIAAKITENVEKTVAGLDVSEPFRNTNDEIDALEFRISELNRKLGLSTDENEKSIINSEIAAANKDLEILLKTRQRMLDDALDKQRNPDGTVVTDSPGGSGTGKKAKVDVEFKFPDPEKLLDDADKTWTSFLDVWNERSTSDIIIDPKDNLRTEETDMEILPEDIITKATAAEVQEIYDSITDSVTRLTDALGELIAIRVENITAQQSMLQSDIDNHNRRIDQFRELAAEGNLTAEQSIKAEEARVGGLTADIEALERKKQKLLLINLALQTATNLAEGGDGSAITKAFGQVTDLKSKLESFKDGTDQTGRGNVDADGGSLAVIHPDEMIMQKSLADPLRERGLDRETAAMYAMRYHDERLNGSAMSGGSFSDIMTLATLNKIADGQETLITAISELPKKMPVYKQDWNVTKRAIVESIMVDNELKNYITHLRK